MVHKLIEEIISLNNMSEADAQEMRRINAAFNAEFGQQVTIPHPPQPLIMPDEISKHILVSRIDAHKES